MALIGSIVVLVGSRGDGNASDTTAAAGGEVFREAAAAPGPDPFTPSVAGEVSTPQSVPFPTTTVDPTGATAVLATSGTAPGLYGGTRNSSRCDAAAMAGFLEENPGKGAAWAAVHGISPSEIRTFLDGLTPVQLRADTRVTNHGFRDGRATPRQAVLQAGTAVLVDDTGVPRAKCACGNPLLPPIPTAAAPTFTGDSWSGFDPQRLVVVQPGPPVAELVLADPQTGAPFSRPVGTDGEADADTPPGTDVSDPLRSATAGGPSTTTSGSGASAFELRGTLALSEEAAAGVGGTEFERTDSSLTLRSVDGTLTGDFSVTFRIVDGGCVYESAVRGSLTGSFLPDGSIGGGWDGVIDEGGISGDCSAVALVEDDVTGVWDGVFDPVSGTAEGTIGLEGSPILGWEAGR